MRIVDKYVFPPFIMLFFTLLGGAGILVADIVVGLFAGWLSEALPEVFARPSFIDDPAGYERYGCILNLASVLITLLPVTYLSMRLDNKRFEYVVVETEGLYTIPERLGQHLSEFWLSELISASAAPLLLTLPVYLVPEKYITPLLPVLWCGARLLPYLGIIPGTLIIFTLSVAMRFAMEAPVLRAWRVSWLTGSID